MSFTTFNEVFEGDLTAIIKVKNLDLGPAESTHGAFSSVSSTLCVHEHVGTTVVTISNWLLEEKNRYAIISC
jgi:hypothetical protein